jgi:hypothetical protein
MRIGAWFLSGFAVATVVAQGCSSSSEGASPGAPDAAQAMVCDGSLPTEGDGGGAACTACRVKSCVSASEACAADCACGPIEACLETSPNHNFTQCPNAIAAVMGGNPALTMLTDCLDANCLSACFSGGGADDGGGGDP